MIVVSDASPIVALHHLGHVQVLTTLFGEVLVPPAVVAELTAGAPKWRPVQVSDYPYIIVRAPIDSAHVMQLRRRLDPGESEALTLAVELGARLVLIDERAGRSAAASLGLVYTGTVGVLMRARARQLVPDVRPLIERLREEIGFFIADAVVDRALGPDEGKPSA